MVPPSAPMAPPDAAPAPGLLPSPGLGLGELNLGSLPPRGRRSKAPLNETVYRLFWASCDI